VPGLRQCGPRLHITTGQAGLVPGNCGGLPGLRADAQRRFSPCPGSRRRSRGDGRPGRWRPPTRYRVHPDTGGTGRQAAPPRPGPHGW